MNEWGKNLPPKAKERLEKIQITSEDRKRIKAKEELRSILSEFYHGDLSVEALSERLRGRELLIKEAQSKILDSLSLQISSSNFKRRGKAVLNLERIKDQGHYSPVKTEINNLGDLIKRYLREKERAYSRLKKQVEDDPRLRVRKAKTEEGEALINLSTDEAVKNSPQWQNFISQHESIYYSEFTKSTSRLKKLVNE